ncbi:Cruciform DNA binding protein [Batrachochytrium dendrobatidis]|nr:Cruciform DNA binding protein [Batrachochytrium dendrobatidis]
MYVTLYWDGNAQQVTITGNFDDWKQTIFAIKGNDGRFSAMLELPDDSTYLEFKFIVDGVWQLSSDYSTTTDPLGNINNTMIIHSQSIHCKSEPKTPAVATSLKKETTSSALPSLSATSPIAQAGTSIASPIAQVEASIAKLPNHASKISSLSTEDTLSSVLPIVGSSAPAVASAISDAAPVKVLDGVMALPSSKDILEFPDTSVSAEAPKIPNLSLSPSESWASTTHAISAIAGVPDTIKAGNLKMPLTGSAIPSIPDLSELPSTAASMPSLPNISVPKLSSPSHVASVPFEASKASAALSAGIPEIPKLPSMEALGLPKDADTGLTIEPVVPKLPSMTTSEIPGIGSVSAPVVPKLPSMEALGLPKDADTGLTIEPAVSKLPSMTTSETPGTGSVSAPVVAGVGAGIGALAAGAVSMIPPSISSKVTEFAAPAMSTMSTSIHTAVDKAATAIKPAMSSIPYAEHALSPITNSVHDAVSNVTTSIKGSLPSIPSLNPTAATDKPQPAVPSLLKPAEKAAESASESVTSSATLASHSIPTLSTSIGSAIENAKSAAGAQIDSSLPLISQKSLLSEKTLPGLSGLAGVLEMSKMNDMKRQTTIFSGTSQTEPLVGSNIAASASADSVLNKPCNVNQAKPSDVLSKTGVGASTATLAESTVGAIGAIGAKVQGANRNSTLPFGKKNVGKRQSIGDMFKSMFGKKVSK